jgi:hypothetical protein
MLLLISLISFGNKFSANAQSVANAPSTIKTPAEKIRTHYLILSAGTNALFSNNSGALGISFPYTITDAGGSSSAVFDQSITPFPNAISGYVNLLDVEWGTKKHFFTVQTPFYIQKSLGTNVSLGYGRNYYFDLFNKHSTDPEKRSLVLKPSVTVTFSQYGRGGNENTSYAGSIGTIDNSGRSISLLGQVADSVFTVDRSESDGDPDDPSTDYTDQYNAKTLYANLIHREWIVAPKIALSNNQYTHLIHWELSLGYQFSVSQDDGIGLVQSSATSNDDNPVGTFVDLYQNKNISTTYNTKTVTKSPFNFSGMYIGFKIGVVV